MDIIYAYYFDKVANKSSMLDNKILPDIFVNLAIIAECVIRFDANMASIYVC